MRRRLNRAAPQLVVLTAALISAVNVVVALGVVHPASVHLAVVNIGLASVLGLLARGLVPVGSRDDSSAGGPGHHGERNRANRREGGYTR